MFVICMLVFTVTSNLLLDYKQSDVKRSVLVPSPELSWPHNRGSTALVKITDEQSLRRVWGLTGTQWSHHCSDDLVSTSSALQLLQLRCSQVLLNTHSQQILVTQCSISPKADLCQETNFFLDLGLLMHIHIPH